MLPIEANWVRPMPRPAATLRIATPSAPDWLTNPSRPGRAGVGAKVAFIRTASSVLMTPMQLGPIIRTPAARTSSRSRASSAAPSAPVSPKPALMTTSARAPRAIAASTTPSTPSRGTSTTTRSGASGSASRLA